MTQDRPADRPAHPQPEDALAYFRADPPKPRPARRITALEQMYGYFDRD